MQAGTMVNSKALQFHIRFRGASKNATEGIFRGYL